MHCVFSRESVSARMATWAATTPAFSFLVKFVLQILGCWATGGYFILSPPRQQGALERFEEWHSST